MDQEYLETRLEGIRHLLSHLHGEITALESSYHQILLVLRKLEGAQGVDELTGLLRRGSFFAKWNEVLKECESVNQNCGVLMIDIDHFKQVNDTHGHQTGDEVLKRVGELLKQFESPDCISGRYGGEEFAVAIRGTDPEIVGKAEMIRRGCEKLHGPVIERDGKPSSRVAWKCTLSVGMASTGSIPGAPSERYDATRLLKLADEKLYVAKKKGRNRVAA
ncbi:MAG: GGDEF domain-containing protein [Bacteriovoracia bacterium]